MTNEEITKKVNKKVKKIVEFIDKALEEADKAAVVLTKQTESTDVSTAEKIGTVKELLEGVKTQLQGETNTI